MENFYNLEDPTNDITSEYSSDESSSYYSVSSSPDIPSYEEFRDCDYSAETRCSSVSSGTYEPITGQDNPTCYLAPAYWIEVLGIFPTELRGTTYYNPLFYYVPVYSDFNCPLSPHLGQTEYETESTDYCSTDSDTEFSSLSSETYYTAEEVESFFDPEEFENETEEVGYSNDTILETIISEVLANDEYEPIKDKEFLASESLKSNYEEEDYDDILLKNEINVKARKSECRSTYELNMDNGPCGSENSSSICEEMVYKDILSQIDNSFETEVSRDFNSESYSNIRCFSPSNSARICHDTGFGDITSSKISMLGNLVKGPSVDDIKNDKVDKHRPFSIRDINKKRQLSEKCSMTFEFGDVDKMDSHTQGLKKSNTFADLSSKETKQYFKKIDNFENLSGFDEKEIYEKDIQCKNSESTDNYECDEKSLSFNTDDFDFTEEEVKWIKDDIYRRALSGKLYRKTHIPSVAVLPTIYEKKEWFGEISEEEADSQPSCLIEQQGHLNDSLCNLYETSSENGKASEEPQKKPKKKTLKRLREFLARIFCCVKPP